MKQEEERVSLSCCEASCACDGEKISQDLTGAIPVAAVNINTAFTVTFPWVEGTVETSVGPVYRISTVLRWQDMVGTLKVRLGLGRTDYRIPPGLYAVGNPGPAAPILVSANYKLSFDRLRRELSGLDLFVMVVDTDGVNVWCAAGKGTFGTEEIVNRIKQTCLDRVVTHRTLILPQLSAPGVAAHAVKQRTGFSVVYGPVRAADIPPFLAAGLQATPEMRMVRFNLWDRLVLTPLELAKLLKPALFVLFVLFLINFFTLGSVTAGVLSRQTFNDFFPYLGAMLVGTVLVPALLPYIPGRAFAWKGWLAGLLWTLVYLAFTFPGPGWLFSLSHLLLLPAIASFLALNYTGSSTYTSLSGVLKEMKVALPAILTSAALGVIFFVAGLFYRPYLGI